MALSWKTRRRLSLAILLIGLPVYMAAALYTISLFDRPSIWVELAIYVALGFAWALPFKAVFKGVGREDPDARKAEGPGPSA